MQKKWFRKKNQPNVRFHETIIFVNYLIYIASPAEHNHNYSIYLMTIAAENEWIN